MIRKLRRKFVAIVMGASAAILLAVFLVLLVSTESGMRKQSLEILDMALNGGFHNKEGRRTGGPDDPAAGLPEGPAGGQLPEEGPPASGERASPAIPQGDGKGKWSGRFPVFTALVAKDGSVTLQERASFLQDELENEEIETLARTAAQGQKETGSLSSYRLIYARRAVEGGVLVAFADTSAELTAMGELVKSSLIVGTVTLLVFFGASILLARWAVKPVEKAWMQQKQFVGDASHELKTPLTVILSNADMILDHPGQDQRRWAENIKAESVRMKRLTEELLSLARTDDTERKPVLERTDLSYLVADSVLSFEPLVYESGRELAYDTADGLTVLGDPAGLSQLVGILLDNAVKYSSPGGTVSVRLEAAGKWARLSVADTGAPIAPEDRTRIFERFYRGDPSRHGDGGHGLGLSIARSIVQAHRGKIWAESENGVNTFTVLLPCAKS